MYGTGETDGWEVLEDALCCLLCVNHLHKHRNTEIFHGLLLAIFPTTRKEIWVHRPVADFKIVILKNQLKTLDLIVDYEAPIQIPIIS